MTLRTQDLPELLTYEQVAALTGLSLRTLARWKADEAIPVVQLGSRVRFTPQDVQEIIDARRTPARARAQQRRAASVQRGRRGLAVVEASRARAAAQ